MENSPIFFNPPNTKSGLWINQLAQHIANGGSVMFINSEFSSGDYMNRLHKLIDRKPEEVCPFCAAGIPLRKG